MTKEQYVRANKRVYPFILVVLVCMFLTVLQWFTDGKDTIGCIVIFVALILGVLMATMGFLKFKEKKLGAILIMTSGSLSYIVLMCFGATENIYVYAFPLLIVSLVYLNLRFTLAGIMMVSIGTIVNFVKLGIDSGNIQTMGIQVVVSILCFSGPIVVIQVLQKTINENMDTIKDAGKRQKENSVKTTKLAEDLYVFIETARRIIDGLQKGVDLNSTSMDNIAKSTESTAEAIQEQASMCVKIIDDSDKAKDSTQAMLEASEVTKKNVASGTQLIHELQEQSNVVCDASNVTVKNTQLLIDKISEVRGIIDTILNISSQTNLLALNASIEAARAGEAGKGFAVVAEEIRTLSEQTKDATGKIEDIIMNLNECAQVASASVTDTIESVNNQNEMIQDAGTKFTEINREVSGLSVVVEKTERIMKEIIDSTKVISENINNLSATSEEVAASTSESLNITNQSVDAMKELQQSAMDIHDVIEELKDIK